MVDEERPIETKKNTKKIIIISAVILLILIGVIAAWSLHIFGKAAPQNAASTDVHTTTLAIPATTANLDNGNGHTVYVKMSASVEVSGVNNAQKIETHIPEIQDIFQTYLHESRPQDLHGNGFYRLREALLRRLRIALAPLDVTDLYITQLLTQ